MDPRLEVEEVRRSTKIRDFDALLDIDGQMNGGNRMRLMRLRDVRRDRGLSQRELADRVGTYQPRIAMIESGTNILPETAEKIAKALLCDVSDLVKPEEPTVTLRLSDLPPGLLQTLNEIVGN
jgi:DNA-binding Xre family transcriptional regulator